MSAQIATTADVDEWAERIAEFAADGWAQDEAGRVDWEDWADRFERHHDVELPTQMDDPAFRKVQRVAREASARPEGSHRGVTVAERLAALGVRPTPSAA